MVMPPLPAGSTPQGTELQTWSDQIDSLTAPGWTSYTPTWSSSGTLPVLGNGTITAAYRRSANSDLVVMRLSLIMGSTTTYGTGSWNFTIPTNSASADKLLGVGHAYDTGVAFRPVTTRKLATNTFTLIVGITGLGEVTATAPHTWGSTDELHITMTYQPA